MALGENQQYFYAPDVKAWVNTAFNGVVDISDDIISFTVSRQTNAVSTANLIINNSNFKYTPGSNSNYSKPPIINTMDNIIISLKRESYVQVFSGFVTNAPIVTLIPQPIELTASCTLYKAQQSYWDAGAVQFDQLIPSAVFNYNQEAGDYLDGGIATGIKNLLTKVCNWSSNNIIVNPVPAEWISLSEKVYNSGVGQNTTKMQNLLESRGIIHISGNTESITPTSSTNQVIAVMSYPGLFTGASLPAINSSANGYPINCISLPWQDVSGHSVFDRIDSGEALRGDSTEKEYWCSFPWPYWTLQTSSSHLTKSQTNDIDNSKSWLSGNALTISGTSYTDKKTNSDAVYGRLLNIAGDPASGLNANLYATFAGPTIPSASTKLAFTDAGTKYTMEIANSLIVSPTVFQALGGELDSTGQYSKKPLKVTVLGFVDPTSTMNLVGQTYNPAGGSASSNAGGSSTSGNSGSSSLGPTYTATTYGEAALGYARQQAGKPYVWGGSSPSDGGFDCSGLWYWAYSQAGIHLPRTTEGQYLLDTIYYASTAPPVSGAKVFDPTKDTLEAGDLLYYLDTPNDSPGVDHVQGYVSPGTIFAAYHSGTPIGQQHYTPGSSYDPTSPSKLPGGVVDNSGGWAYVTRPVPKGSKNNHLSSPITIDQTAGANFTSANSQFNLNLQNPQVDDVSTALVGQPAAFVTDQSALSTIQTLAQTGFRSFQSAPNGDFVAWFPDFFGLYGTAPAMAIHDIEITNLVMQHDDTQLYTHIGVSGDPTGAGAGVNLADWMMTPGLITVQQQAVMNILFGYAPGDPNGPYSPTNVIAFLQRYGVRPYVDEEPQIRGTLVEFMYAWQEFLYLWAGQYSTEASFTFLPELYPGMLIWLPEHGLQFYVMSVTHQGSRDGGFSTQATLTCPSRVNFDKKGNPVGNPVPLDFGYPIQP